MQSVEVQGRIRIIVFLDIVAKFPELESARSDGGRRSFWCGSGTYLWENLSTYNF